MIETGRALALAASLGLLLGVAPPAAAQNPNAQNLYAVHKLVSDLPGEALLMDPSLVNGWGISHSSTSPWWVSNEGTDTSTLYNGATGAKVPLTVAVEGGPTGQVFNGSSDFKVDAGTGLLPARFIFATESGKIYGWNGVGTTAIEAVATPDAIYLGLTIGSVGVANYLYAANFSAARVDVFDKDFELVHLPGDFTNPGLPDGYAPFGIQNIDGKIYIAYALQNEEGDEEVAGEGFGFVDAFDTAATSSSGSRWPASSTLRGASPWRRWTSASSAATCWSVTSGTAGSTRSARARTAGRSTAL
jgi:uncharacterized protein (TIGR03118 family)